MRNHFSKSLPLLLLSITYCLQIQAQEIDKILLPDAIGSFKEKAPHGSVQVFVTKNQKVFIGKKQLSFFNEIPFAIEAQFVREYDDPYTMKRVVILADKELKYSFIDKVKLYAGLATYLPIGYAMHAGQEIQWIKQPYHKDINYPQPVERIPTKGEGEFGLPPGLKPPPPPPMMDSDAMPYAFYNEDADSIRYWIKHKPLISITLTEGRSFTFKGKKYELESKELDSLLKSNNGAYIFFSSNLTYEDYIAFLQRKHLILGEWHFDKIFIEMSQYLVNRLANLKIEIEK